MYWMRSMWCVSLSSWSMLSLAARCRWNCLLFGEPGSHQTWGKSSELCKLWTSKSRQKWHVIQEKASINCFWGDFFLTLFRSHGMIEGVQMRRQCIYEGDRQGGFTQGLKLTWKDQTLRHWAICLVRVYVSVYIRLIAGTRQLTVGCWSPLLNRCLFTMREHCQNT